MRPRQGDVVIAHRRATLEYEVVVVPNEVRGICRSRAHALELGSRLARIAQATVWLTHDQTHFVPFGPVARRAAHEHRTAAP